jgi:hypothetical protein
LSIPYATFDHIITTNSAISYTLTYDSAVYADYLFLNDFLTAYPNHFVVFQFRYRSDGKFESKYAFGRTAY